MQRDIINLNTDWRYSPRDNPDAKNVDFNDRNFASVCLPHTNVELPHHNFSEKEYCFVSWYRRTFRIPHGNPDRRTFLVFDGVMTAATIFVNGKQVGPEHKGGFTPFSIDITGLIAFYQDNLLAVRVDSTERKDIPPFGNMVDYLTFGGIYRDVWLQIVEPVYVDRVVARPVDVLGDLKRIDIRLRVVNAMDDGVSVRSVVECIRPDGKRAGMTLSEFDIPPRSHVDIGTEIIELKEIELWELDRPCLYTICVRLNNGDETTCRVGFRAAEFRDDGAFYLNGRPLKLRGLNRHQTFPYIGQAAPALLQRKDADIIKYDLACNIVRTSHYPQSPHFLDRCDEIGLLVIEEIPGWQHIGDGDWQDLAVRDVEAMIVRDRNRPSIVLWGVRINESPDNHDFYERTNELARNLDPTRQTGGVRCIWDSELLEDVYTMNDFGYDLKPPAAPRYLNTEFCGHMFPTKSFDQEERVVQHALHHAHIHNQIGGMKSAGGLGWCAFDYNTHATFGSGDRICYHGVMDIFRQPKFAAHFYAAFADPKERIVLEPATYWKLGDRSGLGVEPLVIFSNCDEVEVFIGETLRGRFKPDRERYSNLARPPFVISGLGGAWGEDWQPLKVVGYIDGKPVATKRISNDGVPKKLEMSVDDEELYADGADMTRVSLRITDEFGNILPFAMQPLMLTIEGPGILVGENPFPMPGGRGAVYVRATREAGTIRITGTTARLEAQSIDIGTRRID